MACAVYAFALCLLIDLPGHASQYVSVLVLTLALPTCDSMLQSQLQLRVPAIVILRIAEPIYASQTLQVDT